MVRVVRSRFRRQHAGVTDPGKRAFISYSRKDKAFAEALGDDLQGRGIQGRGINVWIDRRDIPPTAEWMAEIEDGIRRSDNFAFLISPDLIQSPTCLAELAHANGTTSG